MIQFDPESDFIMAKPVVMHSSSYFVGSFATPSVARNEFPHDMSILIPTKLRPSYRVLDTANGQISIEINQVLPPPRH